MKNILIVEDEVFIREIYARSFTKAGYSVDTADDGEEALEKATANNYDIVLLDIMLPKMSGMNVLRELRKSPSKKSSSVLMITNLGQEEVMEEAFEIGADGFILKASIMPQDVVKEVEAKLEKNKS